MLSCRDKSRTAGNAGAQEMHKSAAAVHALQQLAIQQPANEAAGQVLAQQWNNAVVYAA